MLWPYTISATMRLVRTIDELAVILSLYWYGPERKWYNKFVRRRRPRYLRTLIRKLARKRIILAPDVMKVLRGEASPAIAIHRLAQLILYYQPR